MTTDESNPKPRKPRGPAKVEVSDVRAASDAAAAALGTGTLVGFLADRTAFAAGARGNSQSVRAYTGRAEQIAFLEGVAFGAEYRGRSEVTP